MSGEALAEKIRRAETDLDYAVLLSRETLDEAAALIQQAGKRWDPLDWRYTCNLMADLHEAYGHAKRSDTDKEIEKLFRITANWIDRHPPSDPLQESTFCSYTCSLASELANISESVGGLPHVLSAAIVILRRLASSVQPANLHSTNAETILGSALLQMYIITNNRRYIDESIETLHALVARGSLADPEYPTHLGNQARALLTRNADSDDLQQAIQLLRECVRLTSADHTRLNSRLDSLGVALLSECERSHSETVIAEAISTLRRAAFLRSNDPSGSLQARYSLAKALYLRATRTRAVEDFNEASNTLKALIKLLPDESSFCHRALQALGAILLDHYRQSNDDLYLVEAIAILQKAVENREIAPVRRGEAAKLFSSALAMRYGEYPSLENLPPILANYISIAATISDTDRRQLRRSLAELLWHRFGVRKAESDLREAISAIERGLVTSTGIHDQFYYASDLADAYRVAFEFFGSIPDLRAAIEQSRVLCSLQGLSQPEFGKARLLLGAALYMSLRIRQSRPVVREAIEILTEALQNISEPHYIWQAKNLLGDLMVQEADTCEDGLRHLREAIRLASTDQARGHIATKIIEGLDTSWTTTGSRQYLDEQLTWIDHLDITPPEKSRSQVVFRGLLYAETRDEADLQGLLDVAATVAHNYKSNISVASETAMILTRALSRDAAKQSGSRNAIEAGTVLLKTIVESLPEEHPSRVLSSLALYFDIGYYIGPSTVRRAKAAPTLAEIINYPTSDTGEGGVSVQELWSALHELYEHTHDENLLTWIGAYLANDLEDAVREEELDEPVIEYMTFRYCATLLRNYEESPREALLDDAIERLRPLSLSGSRAWILGACLSYRFDSNKEDSTLREATSVIEATLTECGDLSAEMQSNLWRTLGNLLRKDYEVFGSLESLDRAVLAGQRSAELAQDDHGRTGCESDLSGALRMAAREAGDLVAFRKALSMSRAVLERTSPDDPMLPARRLRTAIFLQVLWEWTGDRGALDKSIALVRPIVTTPGMVRLDPLAFATLGQALLVQAQDGEDDALKEAIENLDEAVARSPEGSPSWVRFQCILGEAYLSAADQVDGATQLEHAIRVLEQANSRRSPSEAPIILARLARAYHRQGRQGSGREPFRRATECALEAITLPHLRRDVEASIRSQLGDLYLEEYQCTSKDDLIIAAEEQYKLVALEQGAPATLRWNCARKWLRSARTREGWSTGVVAVYDAAINSFARMMTRPASFASADWSMSESGGLIAEAAEAALAANDATQALDWLERGRGLLMSSALEDGALSLLAEDNPQLAMELQELAELLDQAPLRRADSREASNLDSSDERSVLGRWNSALNRARSIPGFEDLLSPFDISALQNCLGSSVFVYVVIGQTCSYALTVRRDGVPEIVQINDANIEIASTWAAAFGNLSLGSGPKSAQELKDSNEEALRALGEMWHLLVGPILQSPKLMAVKGLDPIRIQWCPVGIASLLPLHAAGEWGTAQKKSALEFAISSYAPTAQLLIRSSHTRPEFSSENSGSLGSLRCVAIPYAPGQPDIGYALQEAEQLRGMFGAELLVSGEATKEKVREAIAQAGSIHFAGHALNNPEDPALSRLLAYDGALTVRELAAVRRRPRGLAFLSACSTAAVGSAYADEAVHLAGSFLLAGFSDVIATLWPVTDRAASLAAAEVYGTIQTSGTKASGEGCRTAAIKLRDEFPRLPALWAPYVHFGSPAS